MRYLHRTTAGNGGDFAEVAVGKMFFALLTRIPARALVQMVLVVTGLVVAYLSVVLHLVQAWSYDENSHGYVIVPIAAYLAWERRHRFMSAPQRATNWGLVVLAGSLVVLAIGKLGIHSFFSRVSLLGTIAGIVLFFFGRQRLRVMAFPLAFLLLMIPLPIIVFNQISFPLQLVASQFGETLVRAAGIDVTRDGNVIVLENIALQVAEACSGIRSLVSLLTIGIVFSSVADTRPWVRVVIVASTIPTAVMCNSFRIAGTAVASQYYGTAAAEGFFHQFSGWVLFGIAISVTLLIHRGLLFLAPLRAQTHSSDDSAERIVDASSPRETAGISGAATVCCLLIGSSVVIAETDMSHRTPLRQPLANLPAVLGDWRGYEDPPLASDVRAVLNADDLLMRTYFAQDGTAVGLYVGYWETQRDGDAVHSPLICLPGSGWNPLSKQMMAIDVVEDTPGKPPIEVNRYVVQKGSERLLVLYWYQGHGRILASEYARKFFLLADAVRLRRSDVAIVRIITPVTGSHAAAEARAERRAADFSRRILRQLDVSLPR